jgi:hypothetical protein
MAGFWYQDQDVLHYDVSPLWDDSFEHSTGHKLTLHQQTMANGVHLRVVAMIEPSSYKGNKSLVACLEFGQ